MGKDGIVTHYNSAKVITWQIEGAVCDKNDASCIPGMQVMDDGKIVIGGKPVTHVTTYTQEAELTPWPFVSAPKLKVWRK
jgi:hypothetical protein